MTSFQTFPTFMWQRNMWWADSPQRRTRHCHPYCYFEFKLRYRKNLKLFSIRIKELFKHIVLGKKDDGFFLFSKPFSWETDLKVTVGDFTVKKCKIWKGNLFLSENGFSRIEMWWAVVKHNHTRHICAKGFSDSNFNQAVRQNINLSWNFPKFQNDIVTKIVIFKV